MNLKFYCHFFLVCIPTYLFQKILGSFIFLPIRRQYIIRKWAAKFKISSIKKFVDNDFVPKIEKHHNIFWKKPTYLDFARACVLMCSCVRALFCPGFFIILPWNSQQNLRLNLIFIRENQCTHSILKKNRLGACLLKFLFLSNLPKG